MLYYSVRILPTSQPMKQVKETIWEDMKKDDPIQ